MRLVHYNSIRATQCVISYKRTKSANDRYLHLLNTLKYDCVMNGVILDGDRVSVARFLQVPLI